MSTFAALIFSSIFSLSVFISLPLSFLPGAFSYTERQTGKRPLGEHCNVVMLFCGYCYFKVLFLPFCFKFCIFVEVLLYLSNDAKKKTLWN